MARPHLLTMSSDTVIEEKLATLPATCGVYILKNAKGKPIYVGKAKSLRDRVRSYFRDDSSHHKAPEMTRAIADFETIVTDSESEALILVKQGRAEIPIAATEARATISQVSPADMLTEIEILRSRRLWEQAAAALGFDRNKKLPPSWRGRVKELVTRSPGARCSASISKRCSPFSGRLRISM